MPEIVEQKWTSTTPVEETAYSIDIGPYVLPGDALLASTLVALFEPIIGGEYPYADILDGAPYLIGTIATQKIKFPPAATYMLGFSCATGNGLTIALWAPFQSIALPNPSAFPPT